MEESTEVTLSQQIVNKYGQVFQLRDLRVVEMLCACV